MKTDRRQLDWGLKGAIPEGAAAGWGARAIILSQGKLLPFFDLLPDRQDVYAKSEAALAALQRVLGYPGVVAAAQETYKHLVEQGQLTSKTSERFVLADECGVRVEADPRGSCGYLYLAAWFEPGDVEAAASAVCADDQGYDEAVATGDPNDPKWSGPGPVPELGAEVTITSGVRSELLGKATVVGFMNTHGYLMAYVVGEHADQDTPGPFGVYGCDLAQPEED
jgi:hypothetical protein